MFITQPGKYRLRNGAIADIREINLTRAEVHGHLDTLMVRFTWSVFGLYESKDANESMNIIEGPLQ